MAVNHLMQAIFDANEDRPQGAYIAPTYGQAKRIAWEYCKQFSSGLNQVRALESELRLELPGGRRLWLLGAENPDRLRGLYLDYVVLDEFADISPRLYPEIVRPALAERVGGALWVGTPRGHDHFWETFQTAHRALSEGSPEWFACIFRASGTGVIPEAELSSIARTMSPEQYEQEFECSFTAGIMGSYYGRLLAEADRAGRTGNVPWIPELPVNTAWDLGISDSTAIWFYQESPAGRRYIDYYEAAGEGLSHYLNVLGSKPYKYGSHFQPPDIRVRDLGSGKSRYEFLRENGLRCTVVMQLPLQDGIEAARIVLQTCRFDARKCHRGLEALRQYRRQYDDARRDFRDRPRHDWTSHAADAFRMSAVNSEWKPRDDLQRMTISGRMATGRPPVELGHAVFD